MAKLTRRTFFKQTSASVATLGMMAAVPGLAAVSAEAPAVEAPVAELSTSAAALSGPSLVHVSDVASGELSLLVGTSETIVHDPELVMRLLRAAM